MTETDIYAGLTEILQDTFMRDDIVAVPDLAAPDVPDWDSYKQIEIVIAAEERFGVKFTSKEVDGLKNVGDLARLIAGKAA